MSPDEILTHLGQTHQELVAERRQNPEGWAFFSAHLVVDPSPIASFELHDRVQAQ
jgi:hypothetical protein